MAAVMLFLFENNRRTEHNTHFCMPLKPVFTRDCRDGLHFMDEPTSGLNPIVRDEILDIFLDFIQDETHSIFVSSHIVENLEKIADYITFIHKGRILLSEDKDSLLEKYVVLKGPKEVFLQYAPSQLIGYKENSFGAQAMIERRHVKNNPKSETLAADPA